MFPLKEQVSYQLGEKAQLHQWKREGLKMSSGKTQGHQSTNKVELSSGDEGQK